MSETWVPVTSGQMKLKLKLMSDLERLRPGDGDLVADPFA